MFKGLILSAVVAAIPAATHANPLGNEFCTQLGKLAGLVAIKRDLGESAYDNRSYLVDNGLDSNLANLVITIVYENAPYETPELVSGLTYLGCIKSLNQ